MSRIHEALQKAQQKGATGQEVQVQEPAGDDGLTVENEAFPIESAERRRVKTAEPNAPAAAPRPPVPEGGTTSVPAAHALSFERIDARYAGKIVVDENMSAESREQYRRLAASLHHAQAATGIKVVMLTSAVMGEGKTLTSSNLALTLSESYHKQVLLID